MQQAVQRNQKRLSKQLLQAKPRNKKIDERQREPLLAVAYKDDSKCPVLLSTKATAGFIEITRARNKEIVKVSKIVKAYNDNMGGDMHLYKYLDERWTLKWTKKLLSLFGADHCSIHTLSMSRTVQTSNFAGMTSWSKLQNPWWQSTRCRKLKK